MTGRQSVGMSEVDDTIYFVPHKPTPNLAIEIGKPKGIDDGLWAELTPKQKVVVAHRVLCVSEYRKEMV